MSEFSGKDQGLFVSLFLHECHFFGLVLGAKTPAKEIEEEGERFLDWFYELATREHGDKTNLRFESPNIRVGVIFVASPETFNLYGSEAYIRRAEKYAVENFGAVYVIARGKRRGGIALRIAKELIDSRGFKQLNRKTQHVRQGLTGDDQVITCVSLKPDLSTIRYNAWEKLKTSFQQKMPIVVIIHHVFVDHIVVDAFGVKVDIQKDELSDLDFPDASKLFKEDQELSVNILELDETADSFHLSNKGTTTDPKKIIELNVADVALTATIHRILKKDSIEYGMIAETDDSKLNVMIHRSNAIPSRYVDLSEKYEVEGKVSIRLIGFNVRSGQYSGKIDNLSDPWEDGTINKFFEGQKIISTIREITEKYITCELVEGLDARIPVDQFSWNTYEENLSAIQQLRVSTTIEAKIVRIDKERKLITLSVKHLTVNPAETFLNKNRDKVVDAMIVKIKEGIGIELAIDNNVVHGFVPLREVMWSYCASISEIYRVGQSIKLKPLGVDSESDKVVCSIKRIRPNEFSHVRNIEIVGQMIMGNVIGYYGDFVIIEASYDSKIIQSYVYKFEVSQFKVRDENFRNYLRICCLYGFTVKRKDAKSEILELSRRGFLKGKIDGVKYGKRYPVYVTHQDAKGTYVYCDDFEAVMRERLNRKPFEQVNVIVARKDETKNIIEVEPA